MAWDHFIGRFSYNLAKLTQQILVFFGVVKQTWAHNAFEYDADQAYLQYDVCYVIVAVSGVNTIRYYQRTSASPLELTGTSPLAPGQTDWTPAPQYSSLYPSLPVDAPGYQQSFSLVDLSNTGTYAANTWFPVVSAPLTSALVVAAQDANTILTKFEAYVVGAVSGQANPCRASLSALVRTPGWNVVSGIDSADYPTGAQIFNQSFIDNVTGADLGIAVSPIGFTMLPLGQRVVLWLRGGSKYGVWNSFGASFSVKTASYDDGAGDASITPQLTRQFTYNPLKVWGRFAVPTPVIAEDATNKTYVDAADVALANAIVLKADIASPTFTGDPKAPTPAPGDNDTSLATTAFVTAAVAAQAAAGADTPAVYPAAGTTLTKGKLNRITPAARSVVLPVGVTDGESVLLDATEAGVVITQGTANDLVRMPGNGGSTKGVTGQTIIPPGFYGVLRFIATWFALVAPVKIANPATLPASDGRGSAWSPDGRYLAAAHDTTPFVTIYDWVTGVPIKITNPATLPTGNASGVAWSPDGRYLVVGHVTTPFITIYDWITGVPVKITDPATLPGGNGRNAVWSPNGRDLALAHATTPFVTIYDWAVAATNAWKLIPTRMLPGGTGLTPISPLRAFNTFLFYMRTLFR